MVGTVCSLHSSAPFSRDAVVLANEKHPDSRMIFGREHADGSVEGERMSDVEWRELLECGEALAFADAVPLRSGAKCWLLCKGLPALERAAEELRAQTDAVLREEAREGVLIFVVDEQRAAELLERWSRDAFDHAWWLGQQGDWERALEYADLAWLMDLSLNLDRVALLVLAFEQTEGASAAEDLIAFEINSRQARPERELRALIADYRVQLSVGPRLAPPLAVRMRELKSRIGDIERWKAERSKTDRVFPFRRAATRTSAPRSA
jgi:hypothetical protein